MHNNKCTRCGLEKTPENLDKFGTYTSKYTGKKYPKSVCKKCDNEIVKSGLYRREKRSPMAENSKCSSFLGIYIGERVLSNYFDHVERMPNNNPGYDFICGRGFKIDVKTSCERVGRRGIRFWSFAIQKNKIADHFLCLAFDDRESLTPVRMWLIPGNRINHLEMLSISVSTSSVSKWTAYEKPLDKVLECYNALREH